MYLHPLSSIAEKCSLGIVAMSSARRRVVNSISTSLKFCQDGNKTRESMKTNFTATEKRLRPVIFTTTLLTVSVQINELYQERMLFSNMNSDILMANIMPYSHLLDYLQILSHFRLIIRQRASVDSNISDYELCRNITTTLNVSNLIHTNVIERDVLLHTCPSCNDGRLQLKKTDDGQTITCLSCEGSMLDPTSGNTKWSLHNLDKLLTQIDSEYGFQIGVDCIELNNYTAQTRVESIAFVTPYKHTYSSRTFPDDGRFRERHIDPFFIPKRLTKGSRWQSLTYYPVEYSHKKSV